MAILLISWTFRLQEPSKKLAVIILMISSGVALASHGELRFNLIGFLTQAAAVAVSPFSLPNPRFSGFRLSSMHMAFCLLQYHLRLIASTYFSSKLRVLS